MATALTAERLRELMAYEPMTGVFTNRVSRGAAGAGKVAGGLDLNGYHTVAVDGRRLYGHRLAWLYVHGVWPHGEIDHINGEKGDNRLCNLRDVPRRINTHNLRNPKSHNTVGMLGVRRMRGRFQARIVVDGKTTCLGTFDCPEQAGDAYMTAKRRMHAGCVG